MLFRKNARLYRKVSAYLAKHLIEEPTLPAPSIQPDQPPVSQKPTEISRQTEPFAPQASRCAKPYEHEPHALCQYDQPDLSSTAGLPPDIDQFVMGEPALEEYDSDESAPACAGCPDINNFINANYSGITFAGKLTLYMHERDITTAMIYKRCFVDRKLISKIIASDNYHPSKRTAFALCIALRLSLKESMEFLELAGFTFNRSRKYDLIIKFMLKNQIYDIDKINDILFQFGEPCFGT